jgi:hypothetical protein
MSTQESQFSAQVESTAVAANLFSTLSQLSSFIGWLRSLLIGLDPEKIKAVLDAIKQIIDIIAPLLQPAPGTASAYSVETLADLPELVEVKRGVVAAGFDFVAVVKLAMALFPLYQKFQSGGLTSADLVAAWNVIKEFLATLKQ